MQKEAFKSALVIGSSGGVGAGLVTALRGGSSNVSVTTLSRTDDGLDLTNEESVSRAAAGLAGAAPFDLIINASGVLAVDGAGPEKSFKEIDPVRMIRAFEVNALGAALAIKHFGSLLERDGRAVLATLSARVGSIGDNGLGGWVSYRASKAALNQIVRCGALELGRRNPSAIVVALHPGTIKTPLTEKYARGRYTASAEDAAQAMLNVLGDLPKAANGGFYDYAGKPVPW